VAGINVIPTSNNQPPQVELQVRSQQPIKVQGTVNNEDVKSLLINVLRNNDRFDPDVRLDAVDLLRARNNDQDVRSALCHAVHTDSNAAVRLKALEALNGAEPQDIIRQTLLDALVDDKNPGVRVEAINALRGMAAKGQVVPDDHMLAVLRERMRKDPNTYIRIQSAAAIRDLGPREKF
jgi:HEAT repeat protein